MRSNELISGSQNPPEILVKRDKVNEETFKRIIRKMGLKVTEQRVAILTSLSKGRAHVTAQEVYEAVAKVDPTIGFATVYRFLRNLTEHKFVTEVRMGGLPARYELAPKNHHDHLTCQDCGRIIEFENHEIEQLQEKVAKHFGFFLSGHVLELYGQCLNAKCEYRNPKKSKA